MRSPLVLVALIPLLLNGCAPAGPNYVRPSVHPTAPYRGATITADQARSIADVAWFDLFNTPELAALVREALDRNLDLMTALARVDEFRGRAALARADLTPSFSGSFDTSASPTGTKFDNAYTAGLFFNWEIDFFGRLRRSAEAARADLLASEEGSRAVMSSIATSVAQLYLTLRSFDEQRTIILRTIDAQDRALSLVETQNRGGVSSGAEVQQARNQLATTRASLPRVERSIILVENQLSVLLGRHPGDIARGGEQALPTGPDIPVGLSSELLERRPDIRAAEARLRGAVARIGVAEAAKIPVPRIGLTGSFGRISTSLDDFFSGGVKAENLLSVGPFLQVPLYDGGAGGARVRIARAQAEQAALDYRSTILVSLQEVADALVTLQKTREEIVQNEARTAAGREYLRLTDLRYRGGVASYLEVLDAQRQLFSAEIDLAESRRTELLSFVDLYRALGGGWSDDELRKLGERPMEALQ